MISTRSIAPGQAPAAANTPWGNAVISPAALQIADRPQAASAATPSITQFLDAANAEYVLGGVPAGMHAFTFLGVPVSYTDDLTGCSAQVWVTAQNQIVIAYQGTTGGEYLGVNPAAAISQIAADIGIWAGTVTPAEGDSLNFANFVVGLAKDEGYSTSNIFVTGHSLGGIEAEYVAQQTGLGGVAFEATGIPVSKGEGSGSNFVNVVTYGDPVGNYSSDLKGEQPFAPTYVAGGGSLPHYGSIVEVGTPSDQTTLSQGVADWGQGVGADASVLANLIGLLTDFHLPGVQAHDLGVSLSPYSALVDGLGVQNRAVFSVGGDSISQLLSAAGSSGHLFAA